MAESESFDGTGYFLQEPAGSGGGAADADFVIWAEPAMVDVGRGGDVVSPWVPGPAEVAQDLSVRTGSP